MFRRLYLDTNVLYGGWPSLSTRVKALFLRARQLNVELSIPAPVELELRRQMQARVVEALERFETANRNLVNLVSDFDDDFVSEPMTISLRDAMEKYDDVCESAKREWEIRSVPFSSEPVEFFFGLANERIPPFKNVGKNGEVAGFKDAVILWSIYADVERSPECPCALLTLDGDFKREPMARTLAARGLALELYERVEHVLANLDKHMSEHLRAALSERETLAHEAVYKNQKVIEGQITQSLTLEQMRVLIPSDRDVLRCSGFCLEKIEAVIVGDIQTEDDRAPVEASVTILGELSCDVLWLSIMPTKDIRRVWLEIDLEIAPSSYDIPSITFRAVRPSFVHRELANE